MIKLRYCLAIYIISVCVLLCPMELLAGDVLSEKPGYVNYEVKKGDSLSNIFLRLGIRSMWAMNGYIEKTVRLNKKHKNLSKSWNYLIPKQILKLPIVMGDPRYSFVSNYQGNFIVVPPLGSLKNKSKRRKRRRVPRRKIRRRRDIASMNMNTVERVENFSFDFNCAPKTTYDDVGAFLEKNKRHIKNMKVSFRCDKAQGKEERSLASVGGEDFTPEKIKLKPWMMSYANYASFGGSGESESSFYFPSIGYSVISYKEGATTETNFNNLFLSFRYRNILARPSWQIDTEVKYGVLDLGNDVAGSEAHLLDVDLRLGRAIPIMSEPWRLTLFAGIFYSQMFVKEQLYGYRGIYYPQIYPELRRVFNSGSSVSIFLKYMPTGKDFLSSENNEQAFTIGAQYDFDFMGSGLFLNLNHSSLKFTSGNGNTPVEVMQQNFGIGGGF